LYYPDSTSKIIFRLQNTMKILMRIN